MNEFGRLFDIEGIPEIPLFRAPRRAKGARGIALDARFSNDYPPAWEECEECYGDGFVPPEGATIVKISNGALAPKGFRKSSVVILESGEEIPLLEFRLAHPCSECLGMGSLKARVRREAGHRCVRCLHPYVPKGDAAMLGVEPSGMVPVVVKGQSVGLGFLAQEFEMAWIPWSACDEQCRHAGPTRFFNDQDEWVETPPDQPAVVIEEIGGEFGRGRVEAIWRVLTVHHLDGDKANVRWWNLVALCQRCHLEIQAKVVMERVYPHEHSPWFRPYVAGYYAWVYLKEELTRAEVEERMDELLALERMA